MVGRALVIRTTAMTAMAVPVMATVVDRPRGHHPAIAMAGAGDITQRAGISRSKKPGACHKAPGFFVR